MKMSHRSTSFWNQTIPGRLIVFVNTTTQSSISTSGTS